MAGKKTRRLLVVVTVLTLAVGALGVTGGIGPDGAIAQGSPNPTSGCFGICPDGN